MVFSLGTLCPILFTSNGIFCALPVHRIITVKFDYYESMELIRDLIYLGIINNPLNNSKRNMMPHSFQFQNYLNMVSDPNIQNHIAYRNFKDESASMGYGIWILVPYLVWLK